MSWITIELTETEKGELIKAENQVKKLQLLKRIQCIRLKDKNWKNVDLSLFFGVCIDTITNWLKAYKSGGVEALLDWNYKGRASILTKADQEKIKARNKKTPFKTAKEAKNYIKKEFGIDWHLHWVQKLLKKNFNFHSKKLE